jgi:hypothetical protein
MSSQIISTLLIILVVPGPLSHHSAAAELDGKKGPEVDNQVKKLEKQVLRRLGRHDDYHFVIALAKTTHHRSAHIDNMPTDLPGVRVHNTVLGATEAIPVTEVQYKVIEGRNAALHLILGHMEPFLGQPTSRKTSRRASSRHNWRVSSRDPPPTGDWRVIGKYGDPARAEKVQRRFQNKYDATPRWKAGPSQKH